MAGGTSSLFPSRFFTFYIPSHRYIYPNHIHRENKCRGSLWWIEELLPPSTLRPARQIRCQRWLIGIRYRNEDPHHSCLQIQARVYPLVRCNAMGPHTPQISSFLSEIADSPIPSAETNTEFIQEQPAAEAPVDAPQPRKRGRPAGTKNKNNLKVASTTTGTAPLAPPAVTTVQSIPDAEVLFDVLIRVMMPDKTVKTGRGKAPKVQKVDPIPFGPIELPLSVTWLQLLDAIVDIIDGCEDRQQLVISSFVWRFPTPANALRSGLKNEGNLASLVK